MSVNEETTTDTQVDSEFEREAAVINVPQTITKETFKDKLAELKDYANAKRGDYGSGIKSSGDEAEEEVKEGIGSDVEENAAKPASSSSSSSSQETSSSDSSADEFETSLEKGQMPIVNNLKASKPRGIDNLKERDSQENAFRFSEEDISKYAQDVKILSV